MVTGVTEFQTKPGHRLVQNFGPVTANAIGLATAIETLKTTASNTFPNANYIVSFTQTEQAPGQFKVDGDAATLNPVP